MRIGVAMPSFIRDTPALDRCLTSIENQTRRPDVVAISISSTQIKDIKIANYSFPIRWNITECKQGASKNRNNAAALLDDCDIISFFDTDDEMCNSRLEFIEKAFDEHKCDFIVHNYAVIKNQNEKPELMLTEFKAFDTLIENPDAWGGVILSASLPHGALTAGHVSVRKNVFTTVKFNETNFRYEDGEFLKTVFCKGFKGIYLYTQLSIYHNYKVI